jgi:hypothetical protein
LGIKVTDFNLLEVIWSDWRELDNPSLGVVLMESRLVVGSEMLTIFET